MTLYRKLYYCHLAAALLLDVCVSDIYLTVNFPMTVDATAMPLIVVRARIDSCVSFLLEFCVCVHCNISVFSATSSSPFVFTLSTSHFYFTLHCPGMLPLQIFLFCLWSLMCLCLWACVGLCLYVCYVNFVSLYHPFLRHIESFVREMCCIHFLYYYY